MSQPTLAKTSEVARFAFDRTTPAHGVSFMFTYLTGKRRRLASSRFLLEQSAP